MIFDYDSNVKALRKGQSQIECKVTNGLVRILVVVYIIFAHIILLFLKPRGLRLEFINVGPWPYKRLWTTFWEPGLGMD